MNVLPLVTTNYANISFDHIVNKAKSYLATLKDKEEINNIFKYCRVFLSQKQPKNILRLHLVQSFPPSHSQKILS